MKAQRKSTRTLLLFGPETQPKELERKQTFPGAACCKPIELPSYKAAPLQAWVSRGANPIENEDDDEYEDDSRSQRLCS